MNAFHSALVSLKKFNLVWAPCSLFSSSLIDFKASTCALAEDCRFHIWCTTGRIWVWLMFGSRINLLSTTGPSARFAFHRCFVSTGRYRNRISDVLATKVWPGTHYKLLTIDRVVLDQVACCALDKDLKHSCCNIMWVSFWTSMPGGWCLLSVVGQQLI